MRHRQKRGGIHKHVGGKTADGVPSIGGKLAENELKIGEILPKNAKRRSVLPGCSLVFFICEL